jgi:hypothetical protein
MLPFSTKDGEGKQVLLLFLRTFENMISNSFFLSVFK